MSWGEAYRMLEILILDPSSQVAAAIGGWQYPTTRTDLTLRSLYDLQHQSKSKRKPKPHPRPWDEIPKTLGSGTSLTIEEYRLLVGRANPTQPRDAQGRFIKA